MPAEKGAGDPRRHSIDAKVLAWMHEASPADDEERFDALAREIFEFQYTHCIPYQRFCRARETPPDRVTHWSQIPAVPTGAFKEAPLSSFPSEYLRGIFRTSGTSTRKVGELHLDTFELYEASLLYSITRYVFPDLVSSRDGGAELRIRVLASPPDEAPNSSLSYMFGCAITALGDPESGYDSRDGVVDAEALLGSLRDCAREREAVALCGTSFAFVHLLEAMGEGGAKALRILLPKGSRIMETGGFKGRSREVARADLYRALEHHLGIPERMMVNQYGMTELASQFYDSTLFESPSESPAGATPGPRRKLGPPWARVRIIDPESGLEVKRGEVGMIVVHDLANTGSIAAIETADLGRRIGEKGEGFEVIGRSPGAEARGCSIAVDAMWLGDHG